MEKTLEIYNEKTLLETKLVKVFTVLLLFFVGTYFSGKVIFELNTRITGLLFKLEQAMGLRSQAGILYFVLIFCMTFTIIAPLFLLWVKFDKKLAGPARLSMYSLVFATCSAAALCFFFSFDTHKSVFRLILTFLIFFFYKDVLNKPLYRKIRLCSMLVGICFGLFSFFGFQLAHYGRLEIFYLSHYVISQWILHLIGSIFLFFALLMHVFSFFLARTFTRTTRENLFPSSAFKATLSIGGIIFLCYLPYFVAFFPGSISADSIVELNQCFYGMYTNHHPVIHMLTIKPFIWIGNHLGSINLGVGLYSLCQMAVMSLIFGLAIWYLQKRGTARWLLLLTLAHYALFSIHAFYSITMWKDVLFGGIALLLMILLIDEIPYGDIQAPQPTSSARIRMFLLILTSFLFCTVRNNGFHAFLLGFPFFILANRRQWKRFLTLGCTVLLLVLGYHSFLFNVLGIQKSEAGESLSIPLQQIARSVKYHGSTITAEEYDLLEEFFFEPELLGERYNIIGSDPVKASASFRSDAYRKNPLRFAKLWLNLGLRFPKTYLDAFFLQNYGYWYPDVHYWQVAFDIHPNEFGVSRLPQASFLRYALKFIYYMFSEASDATQIVAYDVDGNAISPFFSLALMIWLLIISVTLLYVKGQGRVASPVFLLAALYLTTLASPVFAEYRYVYGIITSIPLFFALSLSLKAEENFVKDKGRTPC